MEKPKYKSIEDIDKNFDARERSVQLLAMGIFLGLVMALMFVLQILPAMSQADFFKNIFPTLAKNIISENYVIGLQNFAKFASVGLICNIVFFILTTLAFKKQKGKAKKEFLERKHR